MLEAGADSKRTPSSEKKPSSPKMARVFLKLAAELPVDDSIVLLVSLEDRSLEEEVEEVDDEVE